MQRFFWFFSNAYETIENWFAQRDRKSTLTNINKFFDENVKVIWYEIPGDTDDAIGLFERLNIGKIPLTSAELVKAMFLTKSNIEKAFGNIVYDNKDYGITLYTPNRQVEKCVLHLYDRGVDIEYDELVKRFY